GPARALPLTRDRLDRQDGAGGGTARVGAHVHRGGAGVVLPPGEEGTEMVDSGDRLDHPDLPPGAFEFGTLLDVEFEERGDRFEVVASPQEGVRIDRGV